MGKWVLGYLVSKSLSPTMANKKQPKIHSILFRQSPLQMSGVNRWDPKFVTESQILQNVSIDGRILHTLCPGSMVGDDYTKCMWGGGGKEEVSVA